MKVKLLSTSTQNTILHIIKYLYVLNTSTKSIQELKKTGNYSMYTQVFGNQV